MQKIIFGGIFCFLAITQSTFAFSPKETQKYFNGPIVSNITNNSATVSLSNHVLADITEDEKKGIYFEYIETKLACPAIYPTPEYCLPKKTAVGSTTAILTGLKPNTTYSVKYKRDNTIRCITTPCPGNEFESLSVDFTTSNNVASTTPAITKNLRFGMFGEQVKILQKILIDQGYLTGKITGFFGLLTRNAVINYQKMHNITPNGIVGPLTRATFVPKQGEYFEGTISAFSTSCFVDGECSVTVGGKKVVTTRGWARDPVGTLQGVESISDIQNKIGHNAKVYAAKTDDGYTLYGNTNFYLKVE
jgi:peptidoglycan hydrolase-like protein with peptidoglycan-binding domain